MFKFIFGFIFVVGLAFAFAFFRKGKSLDQVQNFVENKSAKLDKKRQRLSKTIAKKAAKARHS